MEYPREFSREARNRIEIENILARRELEKARQTLPLPDWSPNSSSPSADFQQAFISAILRVFLVFVEEAVAISRSGKWAVDRVDRDSQEFLMRLTVDFYYEEGHDRARNRVPEVASNWGGGLVEWVHREFRKTPEWKRYQDLLLNAAGSSVPSAPFPNDVPGSGLQQKMCLTEDQTQRLIQADRELQSNLDAHEQMREIVDPGEWHPAARSVSGPTLTSEISKLETEIKKFAIQALNIRAEALWIMGAVAPFRKRLESDSPEIWSGRLRK
jgi:hypothetical protein